MTQKDRDRLVVLKKAQKRLIRQREAAEELQLTERHTRRLLKKLKQEGDRAVVHGLRGRASNRRLGEKQREKATRILSQEVYRGFGPTLAAEYLAKKHGLKIGRETLRKLMMGAQLWQGQQRKLETVHVWRERRHSRGEMVQWDTSDHDWLEGRGERFYLIHMIDDATSELTARFVPHDSTEENMRLLKAYLERNGRPVAFYTDKASLFQTTPKIARDQKELPRDEREPLPPTQIGRALRELGIRLDRGAFPAGQGPRGTQFPDGSGSAGQGAACGGSEDPGASQPVPGARVRAVVEPASETAPPRIPPMRIGLWGPSSTWPRR